MNIEQALTAIKTLRDQINDHPMPGDGSVDWINSVLYKLDQASDIIEFPTEANKAIWK